MVETNNIVFYQTENADVVVNVVYKDETFWLSQKAMAALFDVNPQAITKHLSNIYEEQELVKDSTCSILEQVQKEGNRNVKRSVEFYNLDAIIAVGYRVNSKKATKFRQWATTTLREYIKKGFVLNETVSSLVRIILMNCSRKSEKFGQVKGVHIRRLRIFLSSVVVIMTKTVKQQRISMPLFRTSSISQ